MAGKRATKRTKGTRKWSGKVKTISTNPPARIIHKKRPGDCAQFGVEESVAEGAGVRDAHAQLLHKSRGTQSERVAAGGTESREKAAFWSHSP